MEEVRDYYGKLVSVVDTEKGIVEYCGTGRVGVKAQLMPGCAVEIDRNNTATVIRCVGPGQYRVNSYPISK